MCYGIEEVPEGDYYCVACRYFKRDQMNMSIANERNRNPNAPRMPFPQLPIRCELCPIKHGAYIRTLATQDESENSVTKWVHMACAKWQGLHFVDMNPEIVEDVTNLKRYFRALDYACCLCQGKRGAYHKCRDESCDNWLHVNCARLSGLCEVNFGEDVEGNETENAWTLLCPDHSELDNEADPGAAMAQSPRERDCGIKPKPIPVEQLICAAKEFPEEPLPEGPLPPYRNFNKLDGKDRARALANPAFEAEFFNDMLTKKFSGARCEVCNQDDIAAALQRCSSCFAICCSSCNVSSDEEKKIFKCVGCQYKEDMTKEGNDFEAAKCSLCNEKGGILLNSFAKPVGRSSYWKLNPKLFEKSIFGRKTWTHYSCAL